MYKINKLIKLNQIIKFNNKYNNLNQILIKKINK